MILHGKILTRSFSGLSLAIQELREPETKTCKYLDDLTGKFNLDDLAWYDSQHPSWSGGRSLIGILSRCNILYSQISHPGGA